MPHVRANGIQLYHEVHGDGEPLLLISGLGYAGWVWHRQTPAFSKRFKTIAFDNRGVGQSDAPEAPYTIELFVADALGLLDALQIERAHVLGASLGGMIAQQLALDHPARVGRLALCATNHGGPNVVLPPPEVLQFMLQRTEGAEARFQKGFALAFSQAFLDAHPEELAFIKARLREHKQSEAAYQRQALSALGFDVESRLGELDRPVLVLAGEEDRAVPVENARRLAERLPQARLHTLPGAGHLCFIERPEAFNQAVLDFLEANG